MSKYICSAALLLFLTLSTLSGSTGIIYRDLHGVESAIQAEFVLNGSADDIWRLLTDYQNSNVIMPNIEKTTVLKKEKNETLVKTTVKQGVFTMTYTSTLHENKQQYHITWNQVEGPFSKNSGSWKLNPITDTQTAVIYTIELNHPLMPSSVRNSLIKKSIPDMYLALKEQLQ